MTMTYYNNGYGRRDPVPECLAFTGEAACPICHDDYKDYDEDNPCPMCGIEGHVTTKRMPRQGLSSGKAQLSCPCCNGDAAHSFGAGMDADSVDCTTCKGWGFLEIQPIK